MVMPKPVMPERRRSQRTRKHVEDEGSHHERWLVSYADFMTLLFAFFVVMYAISTLNKSKYLVLSNALGNAFGTEHVPLDDRAQQHGPLVVIPRLRANDGLMRREREKMTGMARELLKALAPLVNQGKVRVTESGRGISIEINDSILFAQGDAKLNPESSEVLRAIAGVFSDDQHAIQVEGYTDNVPINKPPFPSNWELSAVRASSVVRLFVDSGIDANRLVAVGHGSNLPVASNDTPEGRLRNRRVQVMVLSGIPEVVTEVPVSAVP